MTTDELDDILRQISFVGVVPLDEVLSGGGSGGRRPSATPCRTAARARWPPSRSKEIKRQPGRGDQPAWRTGRSVLSLYYYEGLTLAEIGEILGVTESRVCQIHTKAVLHLSQRLRRRVRLTPEPASGRQTQPW